MFKARGVVALTPWAHWDMQGHVLVTLVGHKVNFCLYGALEGRL